jgi:hypothetical protein
MSHKMWFVSRVALLFVGVSAIGCGKSEPIAAEEKQEAPVVTKMVSIDLSKANEDYPLMMQVPEGATAKDGIVGPEITKGDKFQIELGSAKEMASLKKEIEKNSLNKLKKFHVEKADLLIYESAIANQPSEFHFLINVKVGDKVYGAEDTKGPTYSKADVELMVKSVQSLKAK